MVKRGKPTVAVMTNLYNIIKETIQDNEAYYSLEQIDELKKNPNNIFLKSERKTK